MTDEMNGAGPIVRLDGLSVTFGRGSGAVPAVVGIDLALQRGEVLALLGESGSGKSVTLRSLMRLLPSEITTFKGHMEVDGHNVLALSPAALRAYRGSSVAMIFQEPGLAFDPVFRVGDQVAEAVVRHEGVTVREGRARALRLFERVRIPSARQRLDNYPHELSGGMRQRAMIAMALACRPKVLLADEPTTSLDATVQIQILLLLRELQRELGLAVIFVTHDIGVATEIADRLAVMYAGRIVEIGLVRDVIRGPRHPYTRGLLASRADAALGKTQRLQAIPGSPPHSSESLAGCSFAPRCALAINDCVAAVPPQIFVAPQHSARCIRLELSAERLKLGAVQRAEKYELSVQARRNVPAENVY